MRKLYHLAVEATLDVIGGKWKPIILCHLGFSELRPSELGRKIPQISHVESVTVLERTEK